MDSMFVMEHHTAQMEKMNLDVVMQQYYLSPVARKPVFGVSDKPSFKPISSATETSRKIKTSPEAPEN